MSWNDLGSSVLGIGENTSYMMWTFCVLSWETLDTCCTESDTEFVLNYPKGLIQISRYFPLKKKREAISVDTVMLKRVD